MPAAETIAVRLVLTAPPPGVFFSLEGKGGLVEQAAVSTGADMAFDLTLRADLSGPEPRFLGDYVRGPPQQRFFYFRVGTLAGDHLSPWTRRGKIQLGAIPPGMAAEAVRTGRGLKATTAGADRKGEPACATVLTKWELD